MDASLITPPDATDLCVDVPLELDYLLEVVGAEDACIDLGGDLVQVVADALQLRHQGFRILGHIDLRLLRGSHQEIRDAHTGAMSLFRDGFILFFCQSNGKCLISFSQIINPFVKLWLWSGFGQLPIFLWCWADSQALCLPCRSATGKQPVSSAWFTEEEN